MSDAGVPPTIVISHLAAGPTPPTAANQVWPNVLHSEDSPTWSARMGPGPGPGGSSRTSVSSSP